MFEDKIKDLLRSAFHYYKDIFDFNGNKRLKKNIELYNLHLGNRAFLLATGESIQHINMEQLKNEYTFGINLFFIHEDINKIDLSYYVYLDNDRCLYPGMPQWPKDHLGPLGYEPIRQMYEEIDKRVDNNTKLILNSECYKYTNNLFKDKTKYFTKVKKELKVVNGVSAKAIADMTTRSVSGGGSIYFTLLIMIYMGFKEIYLIGVGYSYSPEYVLHFYDNIIFPKSIGKNEAIRSVKNAIEIRREKGGSAEYYGLLEKGNYFRGICIRKKNENNPQHYEYHRKIKKYSESQGVRILNIVPEGFESPVYEKISWDKIANEVLQKKN